MPRRRWTAFTAPPTVVRAGLVHQTDYYGGTTDDGRSRWDSPRLFVFDPDSFDGTRHRVIYAGTHTKGLMKSIDGGDTWTRVLTGSTLDQTRITDLEIHKSGSMAILYVVADNRNANGLPDSSAGLYKVTDTGPAVAVAPLGTLPDAPYSISLFPAPSAAADILYAAVGTHGIYKSTDGGNTFTLKDNPLTAGIREYVSVSPAIPSYVYVRVDRQPHHFFYSHDGGNTWREPGNVDVGNLLVEKCGGSPASSRITPHPTDPKTGWVQNGGCALIETTDGGATWTYAGNGYMGGRVSSKSAYHFDAQNLGHWTYFMIDTGIFTTQDFGNTWRKIDHRPRPGDWTTLVGAVDPNDASVIVAASGNWNNGGRYQIIRTADGGTTWQVVKPYILGDRYMFLAFNPRDTTHVYASTGSTGFISRDNGVTWTEAPGKATARSLRAGCRLRIRECAVDCLRHASDAVAFGDKGTTWASLGRHPSPRRHVPTSRRLPM